MICSALRDFLSIVKSEMFSECTCFSNITHYIAEASRLENLEIIYSKVKSKV